MPRLIAILRHNIDLSGDAELGRRELLVLSRAREAPSLNSAEELAVAMGELAQSVYGRALIDRVRKKAPVAFVLQDAGVQEFNSVVKRAAFTQDVLWATADRADLSDKVQLPRRSYRLIENGDGAVLCGVSHSAIAEYGTVLLDECGTAKDVSEAMAGLLHHLITGDKPVGRLGQAVLRAVKAKKTTLALTHDLHIYKAKFFPRLARALLNIFGDSANCVVDPFSGSGTTLLESSSLGIQSIGFDVDPISALICAAKVEPFVRRRGSTLSQLNSFISAVDNSGTEADLFTRGATKQQSSALIPAELLAKLRRYDARNGMGYTDEILTDIAILTRATDTLDHEAGSEVVRVLLSDAVTKKIRYRFVGVGNGRYTIELTRQRITERLLEKAHRMRVMCYLFEWLQSELGVPFAPTSASVADAQHVAIALGEDRPNLCLTSPPYLPASSGREHYAQSRALAFQLTGLPPSVSGFVGVREDMAGEIHPNQLPPAGSELLRYLMSDHERNDVQRDPMRFARKAVPTWHYLADIEAFLRSLRVGMAPNSTCLMVVASQHTFYSHQRKEVEYVARASDLYGELAERAGWTLAEDIRVELAKSAVSMARPQSWDDYHESVLVLRN